MKGSCAQTFNTFQKLKPYKPNWFESHCPQRVHAVSPVTTQEAVCTADVCAPVLQLNVMDDKGAIRQYLKTLSPRVD